MRFFNKILTIGLLGAPAFSAYAGTPASYFYDFDASTSLSGGRHSFANRGSAGGSLTCLDGKHCAERRQTGEHHYLNFTPTTGSQSCYSPSASSDFALTGPVSISAWIFVEQIPDAKNPVQTILGRWSEQGARREWRFGVRYDGTNTKYFFEKTATGSLTTKTFYDSATAIHGSTVRTWQHVVFIRRGAGDAAFIINGHPETALISSSGSTTETNAAIAGRHAEPLVGCDHDAANAPEANFVGRLDDLMLFDRVLASASAHNEVAPLFTAKSRLIVPPTFNFLGNPPAVFQGKNVASFDTDETLSRLSQFNSTPNDTIELSTGIRKTLAYELIFGRNYTIPTTNLKTTSSPTRDFLTSFSAGGRSPALLPKVRIDGNLGRPNVDATTLPDGSYGDAGRSAPNQAGYTALVQAEGFRMADQLVNYHAVAPGTFNRWVEDDFEAPRKRGTILDRSNFLVPVCNKFNAGKVKMTAVIYCGKASLGADHLANYAKLKIIPASLVSAPIDATIGAKVFVSALSYGLTAPEKTTLSNCIDEVTVYDQKPTVVAGTTDTSMGVWDSSTVAEMDACVSYLRANTSLKIRVGMYMNAYAQLSVTDRETNLNLARKVAADGYDFFLAPWPATNVHYDDSFRTDASMSDPEVAKSFAIFEWLKYGLFDTSHGANKEQRTRFTAW